MEATPLNKKIFLINPSYLDASKAIVRSAWVAMPMGLLYLASALERAGYPVRVFDLEIAADLAVAIQKEKPFLAGITATTPTITSALRIASDIKKLNPRIATVLGGVHPTCLPEETIGSESVDIVVKGEGENAIAELARALQEPSPPLETIKGLFYKKDGRIISTGEREKVKDIDSFPFPAWHLIDLGAYKHPLARARPFASVLTSRGCPHQCTFCARRVFGNRWRARSAQGVLEEIRALIEKFHVREIHFIDDSFTFSREHVTAICEGILRNNWRIHWATPNGIQLNTVDFHLLKLMKRSGCYSLSFGVESGNQETLDRVKKNQRLETIKETFALCHRLGIETTAFIIVGFPNEGRRELDATLRFLKEIKADVVDIHMLIPLPGTALYRELYEKGLILQRDWAKYVFHDLPVYRTETLSAQDIYREYRRLYRAYYLRPGYILSRITRIRSWSQLNSSINGLLTLLAMKKGKA